jgi:uncharacterized integral membrane protein (TIGR00698 family)
VLPKPIATDPRSTPKLPEPPSGGPRRHRPADFRIWLDRIPGLLLAGALGLAALKLAGAGWLRANGISALTVAIVLGMIVGNTVYPRFAQVAAGGVTFSKQWLLRAGIILAIDAIVLSSTFGLAYVLGTRVFGIDGKSAMLIGAGSSICGAAAVMAAEPVLKGSAEQVAVAVSTVVVFGTLAIFLYPALYHLNIRHAVIEMSPTAYGIYAGSTIHEVAQVVAAGRAIADTAADTAVITKMVRVMMLAPFLILLSMYTARGPVRAAARHGAPRTGRIVIPWFALGFAAVAGLNSLSIIPKSVVAAGIDADTAILATAMAALGVSTHVSAIRTAGIKPLALAAMLFAWLILGGLAINLCVARALA